MQGKGREKDKKILTELLLNAWRGQIMIYLCYTDSFRIIPNVSGTFEKPTMHCRGMDDQVSLSFYIHFIPIAECLAGQASTECRIFVKCLAGQVNSTVTQSIIMRSIPLPGKKNYTEPFSRNKERMGVYQLRLRFKVCLKTACSFHNIGVKD